MCSKCKKIVFHTIGKYPNLGTSENFQTLEIFQTFFLSNFIFFIEFFLTKMFFQTIFFSKNFLLLSRPLRSIKVICTEKLSKKFGMAKNGHSKFFLTIFPKKTGINSEWPKMAIPNFFHNNFFPRRLVQIQNGEKWPF